MPQAILLEDVEALGERGAVVDVSPGYLRNFLVPRKLAALFDRNKHPHPPGPLHAYKLLFLCDLIGGVAAPSFETPEVAFFPRHALPKLSIARVTEYQIEHMFEHAAHPEWPTTFD